MWFGQISVIKVLIFTELWRTESQTEYFSLDFFRYSNTESWTESNQRKFSNRIRIRIEYYIFLKTESESEPNLSFVDISESESDPIRLLKDKPNTNRTRIRISQKAESESETDVAFCIFLRIYDSVDESYDSSITGQNTFMCQKDSFFGFKHRKSYFKVQRCHLVGYSLWVCGSR